MRKIHETKCLSSQGPKMPELPPGYTIRYDQSNREWCVYDANGFLFDGLDEFPTEREHAVEMAWTLFLDNVNNGWVEFFAYHGGDR